jgi:hypothetical protein
MAYLFTKEKPFTTCVTFNVKLLKHTAKLERY